MRRSIIDIGTNTMLLLIADYDPQNQTLTPILDVQRIPRLGKGVDNNRNILPDSIQKAIGILNEYKQTSIEHGSEEITATATSFMRDANNKKEFIEAVLEKTGIRVEILSGIDEAKWSFIGGIYDKLRTSIETSTVTTIDIGGGSTEITSGDIQKKSSKESIENIRISGKSFDVGSVRVKEKFFSSQPPTMIEIKDAQEYIIKHFRLTENPDKEYKSQLIGLAGTITTLGAVKLGLDKFKPNEVDNLILTINDVDELLNMFSERTTGELLTMGDYMEGRADIILSGTLILKCFMEVFSFYKLTISTKGLRYGVFLREVF